MKEATGELNMTVVIVIAVAILAAFFYTIIWPLIRNNYNTNANCSKAICSCPKNDPLCRRSNGMADCKVLDKDGKVITKLTCPWKG